MNLIELKCSAGLRLSLCREGASIAAVYAPDRNGMYSNVSLTPDAGKWSGTFSGATVAPVAGRIRGGAVPISGTVYRMPLNDGANCLHSGPGTLGQALWDVVYQTADEVRFQAVLEDGDCGLPGKRIFTAAYKLRGMEFTLELTAVSDQDTFVNMTNHAYWNLSGNWQADAYDHKLQIASDQVWYNDHAHLPERLCPVSGSVFDFRRPRTIREALQDPIGSDQLHNAKGYNNAFVLSGAPAVILSHAKSGRMLTMKTDAPCVIFYSGGYLPVPGSALAFEPQYIPDAPYLLGGKNPILKKGGVFRTVSSYRFDVL